MGQSRAYALARSEHAALGAAIVAVLVAGIVAAILLPTGIGERAARENGSLLAPSSDEAFSSALGAPGAPSSSIGAGEQATAPNAGESSPAPRRPAPEPGTPVPPPPEEGLLGLLDNLLPPIPPPPLLPRVASAHALQRLLSIR